MAETIVSVMTGKHVSNGLQTNSLKETEFVTQTQRRKMGPRRTTLHLLKPVGARKQSAEVD